MTAKVSVAKVTRPRVGRPLLRQRLFDILDGCCEQPVVWLSAPAGSGKTTLAASYLAEKKCRTIWYQMDEGDGDPATFFYYMGLAAAKAASHKTGQLPLLTPDYASDIHAFSRLFFEKLYNGLRPPTAIVLDNYQFIADESGFNDCLCQGLEMVPEGVNVMVLSRRDPPSRFVRLRANRQIHLIDADQINFTLEETMAFISLTGSSELSSPTVTKIHHKIQGWAAGLTLFAENIRNQGLDMDPDGDFNASSEPIHQYFAEELFAGVNEKVRTMLLKTAFLPKMTADMAQRLTGMPSAKKMLSRLHRQHFFTHRNSQPDPIYQYHPLFREFLMAQAKTRMTNSQIKTLCSRAAEMLEEAGQIEDAANLYLFAEDYERMTTLLIFHAHDFFVQGRFTVVENWLKRFPAELAELSPWFLYFKGRGRALQCLDGAQKLLRKAYDLFLSQGDHLGEVLVCAAFAAPVCTLMDKFSQLGLWVKRLESALNKKPVYPSQTIELSVALDMALALSALGPVRSVDYQHWLKKAIRLARESGDTNQELLALATAVMFYAVWDLFEKFVFLLPRAEELARSPDVSPQSLLHWKCADIQRMNAQWISPEKVIESISEALDYGHQHGIHILDFFLHLSRTNMSLRTSDMERTARFLRQFKKVTDPESFSAVTGYKLYEAWYYVRIRETARAVRIINQLPDRHPTWRPILHIHVLFIKSFVLYSNGDKAGAVQKISVRRKAIAHFSAESYPVFLQHLFEAICQLDDKDKGLDCLALGLAIAKEQGYGAIFGQGGWKPDLVSALFIKALNNDIEVPYVQALVRRHAYVAATPPFEVPNWPWQIKIYTMGKFEIYSDNAMIQTARLTKKPLMLLKALIALDGDNVQVETLSDMLWPDADGDAAYASLRVTLSRARRLLGDDKAIISHEGVISFDQRRVWLDTWAFNRICTQVENNQEDPADLARQAMALYQGDFLPFENEYWMISPRENLRDRFIRLIITLGGRLEEDDRWQDAIVCYRSCLDIDALAEQPYQRLMRCYQRIGDTAAVVATYNRLKKVLKSNFDIPPSEQTEAIFRDVMKR